jgi:hypothetical protein
MNSLKSIYDHGIFILYDNIFIYNDLRIELKNIFNKFFIEDLKISTCKSKSPYTKRYYEYNPSKSIMFSPFLNFILLGLLQHSKKYEIDFV